MHGAESGLLCRCSPIPLYGRGTWIRLNPHGRMGIGLFFPKDMGTRIVQWLFFSMEVLVTLRYIKFCLKEYPNRGIAPRMDMLAVFLGRGCAAGITKGANFLPKTSAYMRCWDMRTCQKAPNWAEARTFPSGAREENGGLPSRDGAAKLEPVVFSARYGATGRISRASHRALAGSVQLLLLCWPLTNRRISCTYEI